MTIILTGGGSGGHITPILAIADELKKRRPDVKLIYIGQKYEKLADIPRGHSSIDKVYTIRAGKFRRYHGEGLKQLLDLPTFLKNIRDAYFLVIGLWQSYWLLKQLKPTGIFIKGGYVSVPVGLAAALQHIPYITHDSDATEGLANRIIARWAAKHTVALPKEVYGYPVDKTVTVGVPVAAKFTLVTPKLQTLYRQELGLNSYKEIIFVTGGGLGALRLNDAFVKIVPALLTSYPSLAILHGVGRDHQAIMQEKYNGLLSSEDHRKRVVVKGFIPDLYRHSGAADVVIARAGATNLAEFAVQHKACIIVPNPMLTGGHQLKNAQYLSEQGAIVVVSEEQIKTSSLALLIAIKTLLDETAQRKNLGEQLGSFARPEATKELAQIIINTIT